MKYLIVANQTLGSDALASEVRERVAEESFAHLKPEFHVVVPATRIPGEADPLAAAEQRLEQALERFRELGAQVTGAVGNEDPLEAIRTALAADHYGTIIISTLPAGRSHWLRRDLASQAQREFKLPVTRVETTESNAGRAGAST